MRCRQFETVGDRREEEGSRPEELHEQFIESANLHPGQLIDNLLMIVLRHFGHLLPPLGYAFLMLRSAAADKSGEKPP